VFADVVLAKSAVEPSLWSESGRGLLLLERLLDDLRCDQNDGDNILIMHKELRSENPMIPRRPIGGTDTPTRQCDVVSAAD